MGEAGLRGQCDTGTCVSVMAGLVDFKNEEEVKEYLDNLGVEYHYACYKEKQPDGERVLGVGGEGIIDTAWRVLQEKSVLWEDLYFISPVLKEWIRLRSGFHNVMDDEDFKVFVNLPLQVVLIGQPTKKLTYRYCKYLINVRPLGDIYCIRNFTFFTSECRDRRLQHA